MPEMPPFPPQIILRLAWAVLTGGKRSLRKDALYCTRCLQIKVNGREHVPKAGPGVVVLNHYSRLGFSAAWIGLTVSAVVPAEMVWVMSAAWTEADTTLSRIKAAASIPVYPRMAKIYNLISMPPLPPRPHELAARALAVRRILATFRRTPATLLAITPEGRDAPGGVLMRPHPGVGRMLYKLAQPGCPFYPVGIYEQGEEVVTSFGPCIQLGQVEELSPAEIDRYVADRVMTAIAMQLPERLRGVYGDAKMQ
jgi:1-acyl-sn-glycerol-3-phosphate acyltransferase